MQRFFHEGVLVPIVMSLVTAFAAGTLAAEPEKIMLTGKDLTAWQDNTGQWSVVGDVAMDPADNARLTSSAGSGAIFNGKTGRTVDILSKMEHGDVEAHVEFVVPKGSNSGVYFQGRYEVQILDSWGVAQPKYGDCGGIYARVGQGPEFAGFPPRVNASLAPGKWQTFDVIFRAPRFDANGKKIANARFVKVLHNGTLVHENVEVTGPTVAAHFKDEKPAGPLMLQGDHGPVAFRNVWLRPLPDPAGGLSQSSSDEDGAVPLPRPGAHGHYAVLTATQDQPPPFAAVDIFYGPREDVDGVAHVWWQIEAHREDKPDAPPSFQLRGLTREDPLQEDVGELHFARYLLNVPETNERLEYRNAVTGQPLLPAWEDFVKSFVPRRARGSGAQQGMPETCLYLGHVLTLRHAGQNVPWEAWNDTKVLPLNPELLVGTGRNFKDKEGHRLPQVPTRQNYTYIPFTGDDYRVMFEAGINLFTVAPDQEQFVRGQPVFYLRGVEGDPALRYPADLYRSNYVGTVMFMDEPTILMIGDKQVHNSLRYFSDAAALIAARVQSGYNSPNGYSSYHLEKSLHGRGVNFGAMRLRQPDFPAWETIFETAHYQMEGGLAGFVHEGRYQLDAFDKAVARRLGQERRHTAAELLRYHYAFLRGGTRPLGKSWGTSIYGQCDPQLAPAAVTLAYDMGARYVWFWTSDHDHHVPWPEQLALARHLKEHVQSHPRPSICGPPLVRDKAIVIPQGYFASFDNLWWVRILDPEGKNEAAVKYARLMESLLRAYHEALDQHEDFDFLVATPRPIEGYRKVVRID